MSFSPAPKARGKKKKNKEERLLIVFFLNRARASRGHDSKIQILQGSSFKKASSGSSSTARNSSSVKGV